METVSHKNDKLWKLAKKRASFKRHLATYLITNGFFWAIWLLTENEWSLGNAWPIWSSLGWGIGLAFQFYGTYIEPRDGMVEREYEKLKKEQGVNTI